MLQNVYISLPYIMAARIAGIDKVKKLHHCQSMHQISWGTYISFGPNTSNAPNVPSTGQPTLFSVSLKTLFSKSLKEKSANFIVQS